MKKGSWKKERTTGRKYSKGDTHPRPKARTLKKFWVSGYKKSDGTSVSGYFKKNPYFKK